MYCSGYYCEANPEHHHPDPEPDEKEETDNAPATDQTSETPDSGF
jgi:hypothetical protein